MYTVLLKHPPLIKIQTGSALIKLYHDTAPALSVLEPAGERKADSEAESGFIAALSHLLSADGRREMQQQQQQLGRLVGREAACGDAGDASVRQRAGGGRPSPASRLSFIVWQRRQTCCWTNGWKWEPAAGATAAGPAPVVPQALLLLQASANIDIGYL